MACRAGIIYKRNEFRGYSRCKQLVTLVHFLEQIMHIKYYFYSQHAKKTAELGNIMKKLMKIICSMGLAALFLVVPTISFATTWLADALGVLSLTEQITDNKDGTYTYHYTLTNIDATKPIWWVVLYSNILPSHTDEYPSTPFNDSTHNGWTVHTEENPDYLILSIGNNAHAFHTGNISWMSPNSNNLDLIKTGETVGGFSFTSSSLDTSSKLFMADVEGFWGAGLSTAADGTHLFSYGGYTTSENAPVPEPVTAVLIGLGMAGLAVSGKRRNLKA